MTVQDLINQLKKLPKTAQIVLQKDDEGNGYRYANGAELGRFVEGEYDEGEFHDVDGFNDFYPDKDDRPEYVESVVLY